MVSAGGPETQGQEDAFTKNIREIAAGIRLMEEAHGVLIQCTTRELEKMRAIAETYSLIRLPLRAAIEDLKIALGSESKGDEFCREAAIKCMESLAAVVSIYDAGNEDVERINRDHMSQLFGESTHV